MNTVPAPIANLRLFLSSTPARWRIMASGASSARSRTLFLWPSHGAFLMSEILEVSQQGRVLRIALNRPDKHNALSSDLCRELVDAINRANRDPHIGAIVLTGNGDSFSAGMDLKELGAVSAETINNVHEQLFTLNMRLSTPLIAAVNGLAVGGGTGLVANCHIAVASEKAKFGLTEIKLGLWPFLVFRAMNAAVGERRAIELALTGRMFDVKEALPIRPGSRNRR